MSYVFGTTTEIDRAVERLWEGAALYDRPDADLAGLVAPLVEAGLFRAVSPAPHGAGLATDPKKAGLLLDILAKIGGANLSAGRLFEGHVNAAALVFRFGDAGQREGFARAVAAGALSGVWNAESAPGLTLDAEGGLHGGKIHCSGAGFLDLPLVTARGESGEVVMIVSAAATAAARVDLSGWRMRGMRATATGAVDFSGLAVDATEIVGAPGDYYRSPGFRGGAWRFCAVHTGAIERMAHLLRQGLRRRGRQDDPHQRGRVAATTMAAQGARLWTMAAAARVEDPSTAVGTADAMADMARLAVERAALEVLQLAERALGMMAFAEAEPIERVARDLATYLRQPFPDAVLDKIAGRVLEHEPGVHPFWGCS